MPKLYEYFGLIILFYSNEHEPIHVHGRFQDTESKAEIVFVEGIFQGIKISNVKGKKPLSTKNEKLLVKITELYREDIVQKWVDFFIFNRKVESITITKKLK